MGNDDSKYLIVLDVGYGFVGMFNDMVSKNKVGKVYINFLIGVKVIVL